MPRTPKAYRRQHDGAGGSAADVYFLLEDGGLITEKGWKTLTRFSTDIVEID